MIGVAKIYTELMEAKIEWVSLEEYLKATNNYNYYALLYDRHFDRQIDNSKIHKVTGLTKNVFLSVKEGLKIEIDKIGEESNKL